MDKLRKQFRPTKIEEDRLLALSNYIVKEATKHGFDETAIREMLYDINIDRAWDDLDYREELFSIELGYIKENLFAKHTSREQYRQQLETAQKNKLLESKGLLHPDILSYYSSHSLHQHYGTIDLSKYVDISLQIELSVRFPCNVEYDCKRFIEQIQKINNDYIDVLEWINTLEPNENIDIEGINEIKSNPQDIIYEIGHNHLMIHPLGIKQTLIERYNKTGRQKAKDLKEKIQNCKDLEEILSIDLEELPTDNKIKHLVHLYPNQERFYHSLEIWAASIRNPKCKDWITNYLSRGRELPFHQIKVFKFIKEPQKAKSFLIEQYEKVLKFRYEKKLKYKKKKREEEIDRELEEQAIKRAERETYIDPYPLGYEGTWAHDVEGYTDEEIEIIFDGHPEAYWNLD